MDLQEFPIMLLEAQLRLCQTCFCCWKIGLRMLSQSYPHRCVTKLTIKDICRHLVVSILNSGGTLGFLTVCCFTCSKAVNYYELLGVKSNASSNEIKNAFFEKSKKVGSLFPNNHPKKMCRQRRAA